MNSSADPKTPWYFDKPRNDKYFQKRGSFDPPEEEYDDDEDFDDGDFDDEDFDDEDIGNAPDDHTGEEENAVCMGESEKAPRFDRSPKDIYDYLNTLVWNQEEAKRTAASLTYNALFRHIKQNAFFVGPTGCGKTHIWRCLQELFPDRILIVDASHVTNDGWKGETKWSDLLSHPMFRYSENTILVLDEADKFLAPKYSHGENISRSVAGEGLKLLEDTILEVTEGSKRYNVDTSRISFVFCGAFSTLAEERSEEKVLGFGGELKKAEPYSQAITEADLIKFGVLPELMGRIQRVANLTPMTEEDYFRMTAGAFGPVDKLQRQYGVNISLTEPTRRKLAAAAARSGLGVRGMENGIYKLLDEAMFEDCGSKTFEL